MHPLRAAPTYHDRGQPERARDNMTGKPRQFVSDEVPAEQASHQARAGQRRPAAAWVRN